MYIFKIQIKSITNILNLKNYLIKTKKIINNNNLFIKESLKSKKKKKLYVVLKSPHVNKKSREHFIFQNYKKNFYIKNNNFFNLLNFIVLLKKILPKNLQVKIKLIKKN